MATSGGVTGGSEEVESVGRLVVESLLMMDFDDEEGSANALEVHTIYMLQELLKIDSLDLASFLVPSPACRCLQYRSVAVLQAIECWPGSGIEASFFFLISALVILNSALVAFEITIM